MIVMQISRSKYEFVFENDDKSLMDQQEKTIGERKQRKLDLKAKEKEEMIRQEADNKVYLNLTIFNY